MARWPGDEHAEMTRPSRRKPYCWNRAWTSMTRYNAWDEKAMDWSGEG